MTVLAKHFGHPLVILTVALVMATAILGLAGPGYLGPAASASPSVPLSYSASSSRSSFDTKSPVLAVTPTVAQVDGHVKLDPREATLAQRAMAPPAAKKPASLAKARPVVFNYTVVAGDSLSVVAERFGTDVETLVGLNGTRNVNRLTAGETIRVMNIKGVVHTLAEGETLSRISQRYSVSVAKLAAANGLTDPARVQVGQQIIIPGVKPRRPQDQMASRSGLLFAWPARGWISSRFGQRWGRQHEGVDLAVSYGQPILAAAPGRVTYAGWYAGYGRLVTIDHGRGYKTRYGHNSRLDVKVGDWVERGEVIARGGSSGRSTGPHVHFEVRVNGRPENPLTWLRR